MNVGYAAGATHATVQDKVGGCAGREGMSQY